MPPKNEIDTNASNTTIKTNTVAQAMPKQEEVQKQETKKATKATGKSDGNFINRYVNQAKTRSNQIENSNEAIANAKPGDYIVRKDGKKIVLTQKDIDYAKGKTGKNAAAPIDQLDDPPNVQLTETSGISEDHAKNMENALNMYNEAEKNLGLASDSWKEQDKNRLKDTMTSIYNYVNEPGLSSEEKESRKKEGAYYAWLGLERFMKQRAKSAAGLEGGQEKINIPEDAWQARQETIMKNQLERENAYKKSLDDTITNNLKEIAGFNTETSEKYVKEYHDYLKAIEDMRFNNTQKMFGYKLLESMGSYINGLSPREKRKIQVGMIALAENNADLLKSAMMTSSNPTSYAKKLFDAAMAQAKQSEKYSNTQMKYMEDNMKKAIEMIDSGIKFNNTQADMAGWNVAANMLLGIGQTAMGAATMAK